MSHIVIKNRVCMQLKRLFSFRKYITRNVSLNLSGIYPPIITTFDMNGNVTLEKMQENLKKWESFPLRGYVVFGTTGEYVSLSEEEKLNLVKCVKNSVSTDKLVIVGTGCESTYATIELTNKMADVGAHAALVLNPCCNKNRMTEEVLFAHYIKVAESSKIPIILYNMPGNTGIDMSPSLLIKLADHPNIIGMKESGGDITKVGFVVHKTKNKEFQVLAGSAGFLYSAMCVGCVGGIVGVANPLAKEACELYNYVIEGKHDEARELQLKLIGPNLCVTKWFGIPGVKASMDLLGYNGGPCRLPLKPLAPHEMIKLKEEFKMNGFL